MDNSPRPPLQNPVPGTTIDTDPSTLGLRSEDHEEGNSGVVERIIRKSSQIKKSGHRKLNSLSRRNKSPQNENDQPNQHVEEQREDEDPFQEQDSYPPSRPSLNFRGEGSLRMGTQTLIQALQAIPWTEGEDGTNDKDDSDENDADKPAFTLSSSIHTIHRPVARIRRQATVDYIEASDEDSPRCLAGSYDPYGYVYLTNSHICFFAHMPSRENQVLKSGSLSKKAQRTKRWNKHWFVLKNDALTWFHSSADPYFPHGVVDLRYAISCDPYGQKEMRIRTNQRTVHLDADSVPSRDEWVKSIRKVIFAAQNMGDSVKIAIPYSAVVDVSKSKAIDFSETIEIKVIDKEDSCFDSYFFAYFQHIDHAVDQIRAAVKTGKKVLSGGIQDAVKDTTSHRMSTALPVVELERAASAPASPAPTSSTLSAVKEKLSAPVGRLNSLLKSSQHVSEPRTIGRVEGIPLSVSPVSEVGTIRPTDHTYPPSLVHHNVSNAKIPGYLFRVLPVFGRVNISSNYFCFRSSQPLTKTRMMIPIRDILATENAKAFRFGHHGLAVVIKGHEELFFEFSSIERRNACANLLEKLIEELRERQRAGLLTPSKPEDKDALLLETMEAKDSFEEEDPQLPQEGRSEALPALMFTSVGSTFLTFKPQESLRFTCLTIGSRGDVQPYIALAKGLKADGHRVKIATHLEFKDWVEGHGIEYAYVGGDPAELMRICVENGTFTVSFLREGLSKFRGWLDDLLKTSWEACQDSDVLIESPSAMSGIHIAEALQIPYYRAFTMPWTRTRAYPHAFAVPDSKMGGSYNYLVRPPFPSH
ncbi:Sterol 3-beta-glucosyltransferase [Serendipita sp. 398]|nr:Sterol 3-beta-glucosyltransferase [Serendipita sp. 398]